MSTVITLNDITNGDIEGDGSFDKLMKSVSTHLHQEYNDGRIVGSDYANVYTSSLQNVLLQAMQFELTKVASGAQADTALEQAKQATVQTTIVTATKQEQIDMILNQKLISDEQVVQSGVQGDILDEQHAQALKQTSLVTTQDEVASATKQDQIDGVASQTDIVEEQAKQALVQTTVATATEQDQIELLAAQTDAAQMQVIPNAL